MITKGVFDNKADFLGYVVKEYARNNLGSKFGMERTLPESLVMEIISKSGLDKKYPNVDFKKTLVPLLVTAFYAVYRHVSRPKAAKPA